jgi:hypothetical protein
MASDSNDTRTAFHPTSGSWPNLTEIFFFGIITGQTIRRGSSLTSVKDLIEAIGRFIDG